MSLESLPPADSLMSRLAQIVLKLNGLLLEEGARTTENTGLTAQRLRVLGTLMRAGGQQTVPQLAREMGLARQSVQRLADIMVADGVLEYRANPAHATSRLLALTQEGQETYAALAGRMRESTDSMAAGLRAEALAQALEILESLTATLEAKAGDAPK